MLKKGIPAIVRYRQITLEKKRSHRKRITYYLLIKPYQKVTTDLKTIKEIYPKKGKTAKNTNLIIKLV